MVCELGQVWRIFTLAMIFVKFSNPIPTDSIKYEGNETCDKTAEGGGIGLKSFWVVLEKRLDFWGCWLGGTEPKTPAFTFKGKPLSINAHATFSIPLAILISRHLLASEGRFFLMVLGLKSSIKVQARLALWSWMESVKRWKRPGEKELAFLFKIFHAPFL